jgi:hypothetical protein
MSILSGVKHFRYQNLMIIGCSQSIQNDHSLDGVSELALARTGCGDYSLAALEKLMQ